MKVFLECVHGLPPCAWSKTFSHQFQKYIILENRAIQTDHPFLFCLPPLSGLIKKPPLTESFPKAVSCISLIWEHRNKNICLPVKHHYTIICFNYGLEMQRSFWQYDSEFGDRVRSESTLVCMRSLRHQHRSSSASFGKSTALNNPTNNSKVKVKEITFYKYMEEIIQGH